jgi:hypothetical protein
LKKVLISILVLMTLYSCGSMIRRNIYYPNPTNQLPDLGDQVLFEVPSENRISRGLLVENGNELVVMIHGNGYSLMTEEPLAQELLAEGLQCSPDRVPGLRGSALSTRLLRGISIRIPEFCWNTSSSKALIKTTS